MEQSIGEEEAEDLLHQAVKNIDAVRNNYPGLTAELEGLIDLSRTAATYTHFRIGRETASPSLTELAERNGCPLCDSELVRALDEELHQEES